MTLWIYLHVRNNWENKLKLAYMPLLNYDWNQQEIWNFLTSWGKRPCSANFCGSLIHLGLYACEHIQICELRLTRCRDIWTYASVKSSVVQAILPAVCRYLLECQNSLLILRIPRKKERTESGHGYFIVTLFISVVYHMSSNILGFIPENMYTFRKFRLLQESYVSWHSCLTFSVIKHG